MYLIVVFVHIDDTGNHGVCRAVICANSEKRRKVRPITLLGRADVVFK
jgi:hypothetical protein